MKRLVLLFMLLSFPLWAEEPIRIGSKKFTEGYLLSELLAQLVEAKTPYRVERRFGLGGTVVCFEALKNGAIDLYPEYTGTAIEEILGGRRDVTPQGLGPVFREEFHLVWLKPFGFNNTYALALPRKLAEARKISKITDLARHPDLRFGFSHEFLNRRDGWPTLSKEYRLSPAEVIGLEHGLAYESIGQGKVDLIDSYSTDAKISRFDLVLLEDDRRFFPQYLAAPLVRESLLESHPELEGIFNTLAGKIDEATMGRLNAAAEIEGKSFGEVAAQFLRETGLVARRGEVHERRLPTLIGEHLMLTLVSVGLAILVGIPLGIVSSRRKKLSQVVIGIAGIAQTIPGIALLVFMIPLFGIGKLPAIIALFLYGLLPILRNTCAGIREISPLLLEAADGIGLTPVQRLLHVELPLSIRFILAGIRTSTVINIGTATLAAFIGAGGLGEPIVTGLALNNVTLVLTGAVPAAALAVLAEIAFEGLERLVTPRGLRVGYSTANRA